MTADRLTETNGCFPVPGQQKYVDLMNFLAKEIAHCATQEQWETAELMTAQLLKMCEMRRQRGLKRA